MQQYRCLHHQYYKIFVNLRSLQCMRISKRQTQNHLHHLHLLNGVVLHLPLRYLPLQLAQFHYSDY